MSKKFGVKNANLYQFLQGLGVGLKKVAIFEGTS